MYNLIMSCGRVLLYILRHFLNYEKIITARMHVRVMMMWIIRSVMK
jgi:hypothetical protein